MKLISWNVNGLRSILTKNKKGKKIIDGETVLESIIKEQSPDIICLQEVRCNMDTKINIDLEKYGYNDISLNCSKVKKGYSGIAILSKKEPSNIKLGFNNEDNELNNEGRMITYEFEKFFVINAYVPNSKSDLSRLDWRINTWENSVLNHIKNLQKTGKKIIYCGDLNVAFDDLDVHNPKTAKGSHGFTLEERNSFKKLLDEANLIDSFRDTHPNEKKYSWYSPFASCRERGIGWRIDFILISKELKKKIINSDILIDYFGSDHVPISIDLNI
jgi:exodeoxyribonuclease-3